MTSKTPLSPHRRPRAALSFFASLFALAALTGGCGNNKATSENDSSPPAPTGPTAAAPTANPNGPGKGLTIAVIPKGTTHVFWKAVHAGADKAGQETGATILWQGPQKENDAAKQVEIVENAITNKVDGIVLAPLDKAALVPAINKAKAANIPLTVFDSAAISPPLTLSVATKLT